MSRSVRIVGSPSSWLVMLELLSLDGVRPFWSRLSIRVRRQRELQSMLRDMVLKLRAAHARRNRAAMSREIIAGLERIRQEISSPAAESIVRLRDLEERWMVRPGRDWIGALWLYVYQPRSQDTLSSGIRPQIRRLIKARLASDLWLDETAAALFPAKSTWDAEIVESRFVGGGPDAMANALRELLEARAYASLRRALRQHLKGTEREALRSWAVTYAREDGVRPELPRL